MCAERLARLRPALQRYVDEGEVAGAVALILRDGKVVAEEAVGYADIQQGIPMRPDAIFRIASMTKVVTTVAVMMLYEQGLLLLTDDLSDHLAEFANPQVAVLDSSGQITALVPAGRGIRIRDLLTHRSGLTYLFLDNGPVGDLYREAGVTDSIVPDKTMAENVRRLAGAPLLFDPGTAYQYSLSVDVLGRVVEVVSGKSLADFLEESIFAPLAMSSTTFYVPDEDLHRLTVPYIREDGQLRPLADPEDVNGLLMTGQGHRGSSTFHSGGAGLFSTAADYARFAQMLSNGGSLGDVRILSRKTLELMLANHVADLDDPPVGLSNALGYGLNVITSLDGRTTPGTPGSFGFSGVYRTTFWADPAEGLVGVLMTQLTVPTRIGQTFRVLTYQAVIDEVP